MVAVAPAVPSAEGVAADDAAGVPEDGVAKAEADDEPDDGEASTTPPARAVPVTAATSAPDASSTTDVRFMANLLCVPCCCEEVHAPRDRAALRQC
jgi:hypothetical protein